MSRIKEHYDEEIRQQARDNADVLDADYRYDEYLQITKTNQPMKSTDAFKNAIRQHLEKRAAEDPEFAGKYAREGKSLDDCATYILNTVKKSGCNGFEDEEIFGMAVHYYDEEKIDIGGSVSGTVVVNHHVELSEQEKNEAKERARTKYEDEQLQLIRKEEEKKAEKERKHQEKLKEKEELKRAEMEKRRVMAQQTLF